MRPVPIGEAHHRPVSLPIRTALIGFGTAGRYFHAPFLAATPGLSLDAIVTQNPERAVHAGGEHPNARLVSSVDELFGSAAGLDLVVVASPPARHAEHARHAIGQGVNVVLDKPMTVGAATGASLVREAEAAGVLLTVYQNRRWDDDFMTLRGVVAARGVGDVFRFESRFEWWKPTVPNTWKGTSPAGQGGGLLYDLGPHLLDQAIQLFGPGRLRYASARHLRPSGGAEDDVHVVLSHDGGVESDLSMSALVGLPGARFRLLGTEGAWTSAGMDPQEAALKARMPPRAAGLPTEVPRYGHLSRGGPPERVPLRRGDYGGFYRAVADALSNGGPPPVDPNDAVEVLGLIEEIHASIAGREQGE